MSVGRTVMIFSLLLLHLHLHSDEKEIDYNSYYRFPLSIGVEYQSLSPFGDYSSDFNIFDISANLRWPIPPTPVLQLLAKLGISNYDYQNQDEPLKWDHRHWYGQLGASYTYRFDKKFEIGGELLAGFSLALFQNLLPEVGTISTTNLIFEAGARLSLNPSYNFSVDIHPSIKYMYSLNDFQDFNGFIFGIGFSASYRFGTDPDTPLTIIRILRITEADFPDLFASMQSYYVDNQLGTILITNPEDYDLENLEISFYQAGFMDSPTPVASYEEISAGETIEVPLFASFNREVFSLEGVTPLTGEIITAYTTRGKEAEQRIPVTYDLYDKTSIVWDDDRKVASFITPSDSAIQNYASFIRQSCRESVISSYSEQLQYAIQAYFALGEIGCLYQVDPTLPFTEVQKNKMIVDSISLPRSTLKNITGDCDDLTVLYCSLLETVGINTAFITIPGHIYAAFNTGVSANEYAMIHPDRNMTIIKDGEVWIPVEITLIGKSSFFEAWRSGMEEWTRYEKEAEKRAFFITRDCQTVYRPVGLTEKDLGLQYGRGEIIEQSFTNDLNKVITIVVGNFEEKAQKSGRIQDYNKLGILLANFRRFDQAESVFRKTLTMDPDYVNARINLGNLLFLQERYSKARSSYELAFNELKTRNRDSSTTALKLLINIARTCYLLEQYDQAESYFTMAREIDSEKAEKYSYLTSSGNEVSGRASEDIDRREAIIFIDEE